MIELNQVNYHYDDFKIDFDVKITTKERVVVVGPSGSGKTTLLNLIAGFLLPNSGKVILNHQDFTKILPNKRPVSMLFQHNNLFSHLTVKQNVGLGIKPSLKLSTSEKQQVNDILANVGLDNLGDRYPDKLSGGQYQRVALARCLIQHRPILLLDEPFSALDQALRFEMLALVDKICDEFGLTLMMVSHYLDDTLNYFSRCLVVNKGNTIFNGPPKQLNQPENSLTAKILGLNVD
jgi:thiamine transport system ATP-binding protein